MYGTTKTAYITFLLNFFLYLKIERISRWYCKYTWKEPSGHLKKNKVRYELFYTLSHCHRLSFLFYKIKFRYSILFHMFRYLY